MSQPGLLLVMTGPSGVGKSTLVAGVRERIPEVEFSVSCTTRPPRTGEVDGVDYFFVDAGEFARRRDEDAFLEHATVHGNSYGTLRSYAVDRVAAGAVVLLDIDVQGADQVRDSGVDAAFLFVLPPSFDVLEARLRGRATDAKDVIDRRLVTARHEVEQAGWFDVRITNDDLARATDEFVAFIEAERAARAPLRRAPRS
ncbi:MAG: guanylate kinase [Proteobacteria bacterium]|nr:guanylate kinase [Pseudomonadota bacterium]